MLMTREGEKLVGVDPEQLRQQLRRETDAKATKQLTVALLYDAGLSPYEIEEILGFPAQTGYNWLDVVTERDPTALGDAPRPGRHPRLSPAQWTDLTATLHAPPTVAGYTAPAWTPPLVRHHIQDAYGIEYSQAHIYRIMHKAGLSVQTARPRHYNADPDEQRQWRKEFKKSGRR
jgi:transposase